MMARAVPYAKMDRIGLEFVVLNRGVCLRSRYIGKVVVGYSTTGTSLQHWKQVLTNPNKPLACWHRISKYRS